MSGLRADVGPLPGTRSRSSILGLRRLEHDLGDLFVPDTAFRVDPKTVTRWAKAGKLTAIRTLCGHRRFQESEVLALLQGQ
jgi:hypothetical protein